MLIKEEKMQERGEVGKVQMVAASAQQVCTFLHIFAHFCHHHPVTRRKLGNLVSEHMLQVLKFKVCTQILMILSRGLKFWNHHLRLTSSKFCSWLASEVWRLSLLWFFLLLFLLSSGIDIGAATVQNIRTEYGRPRRTKTSVIVCVIDVVA